MSDVEKMALWVGLISSIVSIALSVVAMVFAVLVNYRSEKVSDQTIKSLQKIESDVARLSSDTSGLIKAGWDKLLGTFGPESGTATREREAAANEIASGLTSELRTELEDSSGDKRAELPPEALEKLETALQRIQETLSAQIADRPDSRGQVFSNAARLQRVSEEARELARQISSYHLTRKQYSQLRNGPLSDATKELRRVGILVPLSSPEERVPVYWFPTGDFRSALMLLPASSSEVATSVSSELARIGYKPH